MEAVRLSLGAFGVVARLTLRVVPNVAVQVVDRDVPAKDIIAEAARLVKTHDSVEVFWLPFNRSGWIRTVHRTDRPAGPGATVWSRTVHFLQHFWLGQMVPLVDRVAHRSMPGSLRMSYKFLRHTRRTMGLGEAHHYRAWLEIVRCGCIEVGFKADPDFANVQQAWNEAMALIDEAASRGEHPLNCALNVRFIGSSRSLLSPAYGEGLTCYIEALCVGRPEGWSAISAQLGQAWLQQPGALPHWAKEFEHLPGIMDLVRARLGGRLEQFKAARAAAGVDPHDRFVGPLLARVLGGEGATRA